MKLIDSLKLRASALKRDTLALWIAYRDPRTPWYAKAFSAVVVAYAVSPIDLIPDFVPVLGYLDDLILIPAGIALALKLVPVEVMAEAHAKADEQSASGKPTNWVAAAVIILLWLVMLFLLGRWLIPLFKKD